MKKSPYNYSKISTRPHFSVKQKIQIFVRVIIFIISLVFCVVLLSFAFGISFFECRHNTFLSCDYYIVYATPQEQNLESATQLSEQLKTRGAGGNVFGLDQKYCVALSIYKNNENANLIIENLKNQNIDCNLIKTSITAKAANLNQSQKNDFVKLFNFNVHIIDQILTNIEKLEQNKTTDVDVRINIFTFYTQYQNISIKYKTLNDGVFETYLNKMSNIESLLYLLSQENRNSVVKYVCVVRNFLFRIIEELK